MNVPGTRQHFLVIAAASRGARLFIKKSLQQGHSVTALCRAVDDHAAQERIAVLLGNTTLTEGGIPAVDVPGSLRAKNQDILRNNYEEHRQNVKTSMLSQLFTTSNDAASQA